MRMAVLAMASAFATAAASAAPAQGQDEDDPAREVVRLEAQTSRVLDRARPAVVSVTVTPRAISVPRLAYPGLTVMLPGSDPQPVSATGILVSAEGHVATTLALFANAAHISVRYADGREYDARILGADEPFQTALLRTAAPRGEPRPLDEATSTTTDGPSIAWFVHAGYRGPEAQMATVRPTEANATNYDRYLVAPLALRPGAAGGPLLDANGRLLGMAVREIVPSTDGSGPDRPSTLFIRGEDLALAARHLMAQQPVPRPMLGVLIEGAGNRVDQILPGSPADRAGLREGDVVVAVEDAHVGGLADLTRALLRRSVGDAVTVDVERDGRRCSHRVVLSSFALPTPPDVPPLSGVMLRLDLAPLGADTYADRPVIVTSLEGESAFAHAGLRVGDRVLSVDDATVQTFLVRHRIRPRDEPVRRLVIERDGATHSLLVGD